MTSPTSSGFTQFHSNTHPQHSHRFGSTSSTSSAGSNDYTGPSFSSHSWATPTTTTSSTRSRRFSTTNNEDPFAAQREPSDPMYSGGSTESRRVSEPMGTPIDRRMSREWDASKVPPSRFQKPEGSIFATPSSRDGHIARNKISVAMDKVKDKVQHRK